MFDQPQIRLRKHTLDTNDCYFRRLFLIEIISKDRLMAIEKNGLKNNKPYNTGFNTFKIKEYIYYKLRFFSYMV